MAHAEIPRDRWRGSRNGTEDLSERLNTAERALVLRMLRDAREMLASRIERQKSQARRGLQGARLEQTRLEEELAVLSSAIRKIWITAID